MQGVLPVMTPLDNTVKQLSTSTQFHHLAGASRLVSQVAVGWHKWKPSSWFAATQCRYDFAHGTEMKRSQMQELVVTDVSSVGRLSSLN